MRIQLFLPKADLYRLLLMLLLAYGLCLGKPSVLMTGSYGYTHYNPHDLNEVNRIFEKTSRQSGFRGYKVEEFDGHTEHTFGLGLAWKKWQLVLESEIWEEAFKQHNVPFDMDSLRGAVWASEQYLFVPTALTVRHAIPVGRFLFLLGYGPGIMLGTAHVHMTTQFDGARPNDTLNLKIGSNVNLIHRLSLGALVQPLPWVGIGLTTGFRISKIKYFEVKEVTGNSLLFNLLFNGAAQQGDKLYIGHETLNFVRGNEVHPFHHLVEGNVTGTFLWARILFFLPRLGK